LLEPSAATIVVLAAEEVVVAAVDDLSGALTLAGGGGGGRVTLLTESASLGELLGADWDLRRAAMIRDNLRASTWPDGALEPALLVLSNSADCGDTFRGGGVEVAESF
jgi:hypothetical protein